MIGVPLNLERMEQNLSNYDKKKNREMILEASEIVLGFLGFDRMCIVAISTKRTGREDLGMRN
jgi:hypothetical protein